jgi:hypothetical protein
LVGFYGIVYCFVFGIFKLCCYVINLRTKGMSMTRLLWLSGHSLLLLSIVSFPLLCQCFVVNFLIEVLVLLSSYLIFILLVKYCIIKVVLSFIWAFILVLGHPEFILFYYLL